MCDIVCVEETHLLKGKDIHMEGFKWYGHNRQVLHRNAPKRSGGVGVFIKNKVLEDYKVKVIDTCVDGIIGLKLEHKVSMFTLLIYACYLSPECSPHGRDAIGFFSHLLSQIYLNEDVDNIVLCGDFNARIGALKDYITEVDNLPVRNVIDESVNQHGHSLVDFLHESKFCVMNGRVSNENDAYTCRTGR